MNSRERIQAAFEHRQPDRTPIFEYVLQPPVADAILGRPYAIDERWDPLVREIGWEAAVRQQAEDIADLALKLGHDMAYVCPVPPPPASAPQAASLAPSFEDPVEELHWRVSQPESALRDEPHLIYTLVREAFARRDLDLPLFAPNYGHGIWVDVALMQTMLLEPELAHGYFQRVTRRCLAVADQYRQLGIEIIGVGGDFAGNRGPVISPAMYREFVVPGVREVARRVRDNGAWSINASDGNLWPVIDDFLLTCEVDAYTEIDLRAGMELGLLKARFGDRITFLGNLDCANLLSFGTPEQVRAHTVECLRQGWGQGGHIVCCNNASPPPCRWPVSL